MAAGAPRVAALVLAAGRGARMGAGQKLLLPVDGAPIVARVVDAALASRAEPVVVVTGHEAAAVAEAIAGRDVVLAHNADAARGLSSSLRAGLAELAELADAGDAGDAGDGANGVDAAIVCLADMPWVAPAHLDALIDAFAADRARPICAPVHAGRRGNPVLWPARHFAALRALEGDVGGRDLLARHADEVLAVAVADAGIHRDVDTPRDLAPDADAVSFPRPSPPRRA